MTAHTFRQNGMPVPLDRVLTVATAIEADLDQLPDLPSVRDVDFDRARGDRREAVVQIAGDRVTRQGGAVKIGLGGSDYAIRLFGLRATCTSSLEGALRNWISAARRKAGV